MPFSSNLAPLFVNFHRSRFVSDICLGHLVCNGLSTFNLCRAPCLRVYAYSYENIGISFATGRVLLIAVIYRLQYRTTRSGKWR